MTVGTIFSVLVAPADVLGREVTEQDFLQSGRRQVAAGYAVFGPQAFLVLSVGTGVYEFALDREMGSWVMTHERIHIPAGNREFAINMSNERHWAGPVRRYIADCMAGAGSLRAANFNMRWTGSMVADIHRMFKRGGMFLYPWDGRDPAKPGKLRLMYEANPMAYLIEQAGGKAAVDTRRIMDVNLKGCISASASSWAIMTESTI
ncbi:class 1 fructose-bisphosphatase [Hoeflea sp.]|uniref:class 1 fructose-bisphosphatase n=1 Tax=Hoeflea sp. TaxID=1940281 RepID=UPI0025C48F30|nr:class 1 fructose-bisphosphatase [Hoeflea sp.]